MMDKNGLTKLVEECGELIQVAAKKSAYLDTDQHPDGMGSLNQRMQAEMADVIAAIEFVVEQFELDRKAIYLRKAFKYNRFCGWHQGEEDDRP